MWIRRLLFTVYGIAIGVIVGSLVMLWLDDIPTVATIGAAFVLLVYTVVGWLIASGEDNPVGKRLVMLPLAPPLLLIGCSVLVLVFVVLFVVLAAIMPFDAVRARREEAKFRRAMQQQRRFIARHELSTRLDSGEGTLLEEAGPKGTYRIWWTEDDVGADQRGMSLKEFLERLLRKDSEIDRFNAECIATYLAEENGKAILTDIPARLARRGKLESVCPRANRVVLYPMMVESQKPRHADR
jgi:hypothetical protein